MRTVRLFGSSWLGYYYVNIFVGSDPQRESLIVDTGSTITAVPCHGKFKVNLVIGEKWHIYGVLDAS